MTLLSLDPEQTLHFCKTPTTTSPNRILKLTNSHNGNVAFKVKTTAPKAYLVRPSSGNLRPRETQEVQIILQPTGSDGQANNHRFLVQAVAVQNTEAVTREQWAEFGKDVIQEQRLNVVLEERDAEHAGQEKDASNVYGPGATETSRPGAAGDAPADLKVKYDELVQYTLMLEKEKKKLEADMATKMQTSTSGKDGDKYGVIHLVIVALVAFLLSYAAKFLG